MGSVESILNIISDLFQSVAVFKSHCSSKCWDICQDSVIYSRTSDNLCHVHIDGSCVIQQAAGTADAVRTIVCHCRSQWNLTLDRTAAKHDPGGLFLLRSSEQRDLTLGQVVS